MIDSESSVATIGESLNAQRVLVVDDDPVALEIARDALEGYGFIVSSAENGLEGLVALEREQPDLILLDVEMPELNGFDTCERLRKLSEGENIPVIMMTGRDDTEAIERAFSVQATDFVSKPVNWMILVQRIHYILRAAATLTEMKRGRQRLLSAQQMANLGYWDWDMKANILLMSDQAYQIVGHPLGSIKTIEEYLNVIYEEDKQQFSAALNETISQGEEWLIEHRIVTNSGDIRTIKSSGQTIFADSSDTAIWSMGTMQDITEQRRSEETIRRMAFFDDVTGLHNRVAFIEQLNLLINMHKRMGAPLAVLYLDLDDFKRVNDSLGHHVGDSLLRSFADRLKDDLRANDLVSRGEETVLARLGGDEFTLLLSGLSHQTDAAIIAQRIQDNLAFPFTVSVGTNTDEAITHELYIGASIGIAVYPDDGEDSGELLKNADTAMYEAKRAGKKTFRFYVDEMNDRALANLAMETLLRGAVDRGELDLHYQPQLDLHTGKVVGVEALARWNCPELGGNVSPGDFIPLAEVTGQMVTIGTWVLETACSQLKQWQYEGFNDLKMAVNVSSLQFRHGGFEDVVANILEQSCLDARCLEIELTETILMSDVGQSIDTLQALKTMGVNISIDDFGTGYSSLSYLRRFPIDTLKIDQSFVSGLGVDANSTEITNAIIAMAHSLGFTVVAEGIEENSQLSLLQKRNCEVGQGYLFSKPIPGEQIPAFLNAPGEREDLMAS